MPAVLTLQSGEALARSSNLIGVAPPGTRDGEGNVLCLDTSTVYPTLDGTKYDFGDPVYGTVNVIPERDYFIGEGRSTPVSEDVMCQTGGVFSYHNSGWQEARLPVNGAIVSAAAIGSILSKGDVLFNRVA